MKENLTSISTMTSRYQTVIPAAIRRAAKLQHNAELVWQIVPTAQQPMIVVSPRPQNWSAYLSGLGKHVWKDIKVDDYLKQLRSEW